MCVCVCVCVCVDEESDPGWTITDPFFPSLSLCVCVCVCVCVIGSYTRNLVDDGNGRFNVMLLCWNMGQAR